MTFKHVDVPRSLANKHRFTHLELLPRYSLDWRSIGQSETPFNFTVCVPVARVVSERRQHTCFDYFEFVASRVGGFESREFFYALGHMAGPDQKKGILSLRECS